MDSALLWRAILFLCEKPERKYHADCLQGVSAAAENHKNGVKMSMERNRIRPIATGKNMRMSYSRQKEVLEMPNLIEVQKDSYHWFLN